MHGKRGACTGNLDPQLTSGHTSHCLPFYLQSTLFKTMMICLLPIRQCAASLAWHSKQTSPNQPFQFYFSYKHLVSYFLSTHTQKHLPQCLAHSGWSLNKFLSLPIVSCMHVFPLCLISCYSLRLECPRFLSFIYGFTLKSSPLWSFSEVVRNRDVFFYL